MEKTIKIDLYQKVFDPPSLEIFWTELIAGAYGHIHHAEGIFNIVDGRRFRILYDGVSDSGDREAKPDCQYIELDDLPCFQGRPDRPSKLEIIGQDLDAVSIGLTLEPCTLPDHILEYYQSQIQAQVQSQIQA